MIGGFIGTCYMYAVALLTHQVCLVRYENVVPYLWYRFDVRQVGTNGMKPNVYIPYYPRTISIDWSRNAIHDSLTPFPIWTMP